MAPTELIPTKCWLLRDQLEVLSNTSSTLELPEAPVDAPTNRSMSSAAARGGSNTIQDIMEKAKKRFKELFIAITSTFL